MTTRQCSKCGSVRRQSSSAGRPRESTVKGQTSKRLNQKVWAIIGGKMKNVRFYRLVETVFYELKPDVRLIDRPPEGVGRAPGANPVTDLAVAD